MRSLKPVPELPRNNFFEDRQKNHPVQIPQTYHLSLKFLPQFFLNNLTYSLTSSDSNKFEILVFPKQMEEMSNALIEIDLSAGTDNLPVRHLLFNDLRVNVFLIIN